MNRIYKLSITAGTEQGTCIVADEILGKDVYLAEFQEYEDACNFLNRCFKKIGMGRNYNYYIRKEGEKNK
tara:strand:- start:43 stop:252 length:210 start_codon:yes stop_codon:yes gene_type:complete